MLNYADRGGCYPPRPMAEVDNILREKEENMRERSKIFSLFYIPGWSSNLVSYRFLPCPVGLKLSGTPVCEQALHLG